jgi:hypothetical protein
MSNTITLSSGQELDLSHSSDSKPVIKTLTNGCTVVGYLVQDDDCENPLKTCEGMGSIFTARRSAGDKDLEEFRKARGFDDDYKPTRKANPLAVVLDVYSHSGECYAVSGSIEAMRFPDRQWDVGAGSAVWVPDTCCIENIWINAVKGLLPKEAVVYYTSKLQADGTCKNPKDLNRVTLRITNMPGLPPRYYKTFKLAYQAAMKLYGVKLPSDFSAIKYRESVAMCKGVLESFNAWLAGDCWGVCVDVFDDEGKPIDEDACWGHIGGKWANEALEDQMNCQIKHHSTSAEVAS